MNLAFNLYRLQAIDTRISQIDKRLEEIQTILASDKEVSEAQALVDEIKASLLKEQKQLKSLEQQHAAKKMKYDLNQNQLFGGKVRNPKELQDLQAEAEFLKQDMADLDEDQLHIMESLEALHKQLSKAESKLEATLNRKAGENAKLLGERSTIEQERSNLETQRIPALSPLPTELVQAYQALLTAKGGRAVAEVIENCCEACGMELTPAEVQSARSPKTLLRCRSCGRILYRP